MAQPTFQKPRSNVVVPKKGEADLAALVEMMGKVGGSKTFKLPQNGTIRVRIVNPVGSTFPIQPAFEHWVPVIDDKGEPRKKVVICPKSIHRAEPCPICTLLSFFNGSTVPEIKATGGELRQNKRYVTYLIDRSYMMAMANMRQEIVALPDQEKVYDARLPSTVTDKMMETINDSLWGWCFNPEGGYDWRITGGKSGNASFVKYEVTPIPKEHSPSYDPMLATGLKPLQDISPVTSLDDIIEHVNTQLQFACDVGGEEGEAIVDAFVEAWKQETEGTESIEVQGPDEESGAPEYEGGEESGDNEGSYGTGQEEENQEGEGAVAQDEYQEEEDPAAEEAPAEDSPRAIGGNKAPAAKSTAPLPAAGKSPARKTPAEATAEKGEAAKTKTGSPSMSSGFADKIRNLRKKG